MASGAAIYRDSGRVQWHSLALPAVFLLAGLLRVYRLDSVPFWTDELFTASYPRLGLDYLWSTGLRTEPTPPLYYSLIWLIEHAFGSSPFALRLPSVIGSLCSVGLVVALCRELSDRPAAPILAGLLLALAPFDIHLAQDARAYTLQMAALGLALLGFAQALRRSDNLRLYVAGAVLAIWLHPTSFMAVAAINVAALLSLLGPAPLLIRRHLRPWCVANAIVLLASLPLLPLLLSQDAVHATSWIEPFSRWSMEGVVGVLLAGPALSGWSMPIAEVVAPLLALLFLVPLWRPGGRAVTVLLLVPGVFLALMIGVSLNRPVILSRTLAWVLIPLAAGLGDLLARRPKPVATAVFAGLLFATASHVAGLGRLKEEWPRFLALLPDFGPRALIVLAPRTSSAVLAFYAPGAGTPVRLDDGLPPTPETVVTQRVFGTPTIGMEEIGQAIAAGRPVWLIYRRPEYEWMRKATASLPPPRAAVQDSEGINRGIGALRW